MTSVYLRFVGYIVLFSTLVSIATSVVNYNLQFANLDEEVSADAVVAHDNIRELISAELGRISTDIFAMVQSPLFRDYLEAPGDPTLRAAQALFLSHAQANPSYFQVRYIDRAGLERIRIDSYRAGHAPRVVAEEQLQDKSGRYYVEQTLALQANQFWYSKLDLNVEQGQIEQPLRPTLRVSQPVYRANQLAGLLIINVEMSRTLELIANNADFQVFLVDGDGQVLVHPDPSQRWTRYLAGGVTGDMPWSDVANEMLSLDQYHGEALHAFSLEDIFRNGERIHLVLLARDKYVDALRKNNVRVASLLALVILAIAIPVGMFLALWPARVQRALRAALADNGRQMTIIDRYVMSFEVDAQGVVRGASTALCQRTQFSKEELIGHSHELLIGPENEPDVYTAIVSSVSNGISWQGDLISCDKAGQVIWLDTVALPRLEQGVFAGFTAIAIDVTDKKRIVELSERDRLTGLYNRVKIDQVLDDEARRFVRYQTAFSAFLIDVDHFKAVNDNFGHPQGDVVLKAVADILLESTREADFAGRWGGEEFIVLCRETSIEGAALVAEKIRQRIAQHDFGPVKQQTASFGVAAFKPGDTVSSFLKCMDDALYQAKNDGRNRVVTDA